MKRTKLLFLAAGAALLALWGCGDDSSSTVNRDPAEPAFGAVQFSNPTDIDHAYLPLVPGTTHLYQAETEEGVETIVVEVLDQTRQVAGVTAVIVRDRVYLDELLVEDTYDWYAQDDAGNIWYLGEEVINYEYDDEGNLLGTDSGGSWEAGEDVAGVGSDAVAGILIKASPAVGDSYQQEFYPGEAEDMARVAAVGVTVVLADGTVHPDAVQTLEWNPLEVDSDEYKYYVPGVGLVREEAVGGSEFVELKGVFLTDADELADFAAAVFSEPTTIDNAYLPLIPGTTFTYEADTEDGVETIVVEVLPDTRQVAGVTAVVVRDRVYLDDGDGDVLIEDTHDWYAQDDAGHVWYLGEEVVNYRYDDEGNLLGTDDDGAWEAGVDGALPGIQMWAAPQVGESYYQEYYEGEATDMARVVAAGVEVELSDGTVYANCLQVLDWNPLDPAVLEYKYYSPDLGLVLEEVVGGDEVVELVDVGVE